MTDRIGPLTDSAVEELIISGQVRHVDLQSVRGGLDQHTKRCSARGRIPDGGQAAPKHTARFHRSTLQYAVTEGMATENGEKYDHDGLLNRKG